MLDRELVDLFLNILPNPYFERMIGCTSSSFSDLVMVGERIESGLKSGKLQDASSSQANEEESFRGSQMEEEDYETNAIWEAPQAPPPVPYGQPPYVATVQCQQPMYPNSQYQQPWGTPHAKKQGQGRGYQSQHQNPRIPRSNLERRNAPLDPIPVTYSQLLPHLVQSSLVVPKFINPPKVFPLGYDHNARCGYHDGTVGHSTEDCNAYKAKVQQLIDQKYLTLQGGNLFVNGNPVLK
jgi:hypothetical protein